MSCRPAYQSAQNPTPHCPTPASCRCHCTATSLAARQRFLAWLLEQQDRPPDAYHAPGRRGSKGALGPRPCLGQRDLDRWSAALAHGRYGPSSSPSLAGFFFALAAPRSHALSWRWMTSRWSGVACKWRLRIVALCREMVA